MERNSGDGNNGNEMEWDGTEMTSWKCEGLGIITIIHTHF